MPDIQIVFFNWHNSGVGSSVIFLKAHNTEYWILLGVSQKTRFDIQLSVENRKEFCCSLYWKAALS